jgi:hypothetical protein
MRIFALTTIFASMLFIAATTVSAQTVLTSVDGRRVDLDSNTGNVTVLAIGAAWLPLSTKQAEFANALAKRYAGRNVVFYFVVTDSTNARSRNFASEDDIRRFVTDKKLAVPVLRDSDGSVTMKKYKVEQIPSFVIIGKDGTASVEDFGGLDPRADMTGPISRGIDRLL